MVASKPPTAPPTIYSGNLKRLHQQMSSEQRLAPLLENSRCSSPSPPPPKQLTSSFGENKSKRLASSSQASPAGMTISKMVLYESATHLNGDSVAKRTSNWKNKSNERLLTTTANNNKTTDNEKLIENDYLSTNSNSFHSSQRGSQPPQQQRNHAINGFVTNTEFERTKKYASNNSIKSSVRNLPNELYASVNQIDVGGQQQQQQHTSNLVIARNQSSNMSINETTSKKKQKTKKKY